MELFDLNVKSVYAMKDHERFVLVIAKDALYDLHVAWHTNVGDRGVTARRSNATTCSERVGSDSTGVLVLTGSLEDLTKIRPHFDARAFLDDVTSEYGTWIEGRIPHLSLPHGVHATASVTTVDIDEIEGLASAVLTRSEKAARKKVIADAAMKRYVDEVVSLDERMRRFGLNGAEAHKKPNGLVTITVGDLERLLHGYEG